MLNLLSKKRTSDVPINWHSEIPVPLGVSGPGIISDVNAVVSYVTSALTSVKFGLRRDCKAGYEDVEDRAIATILNKPNENYTFSSLISRIIYDIYSLGNAFLYIKRNTRGGVNSLRFFKEAPKIVNGVDAYERENVTGYYLGGEVLLPQEILHFKYCENKDGVGVPAIERLSQIDGLISKVDRYLNGLLSNPVRGFISGLSNAAWGKGVEEQKAKIEDVVSRNIADRGFVVTQGTAAAKIERVDDAGIISQLFALRNNLRAQAASVLGCPTSYLGLPGTQGGDLSLVFNQFIQHCVQPIAKVIEDAFTLKLLSYQRQRQGVRFSFDLDKALLSKVQDKITSAAAMVGSGIATINEAREFVGFSPKDDANCDEILYDKTNRDAVKNLVNQAPIINGNGAQNN